MNQNMKVLLIEDDFYLGELYKEILELESYEVRWIQDGSVAQQYLENHVPDMILLDLHLPTVSGAKLLEDILDRSQFTESKIVLISADGLLVDEIRHKVDIALLKPIGFRQLTSLCNRLLNAPVAE